MKYLKVLWKHNFTDEPILLYSELDENRFETRKIDVFSDGSMGFSDGDCNIRSYLGEMKTPEIREINLDSEFRACEITKKEFEQAWIKAILLCAHLVDK